MSSGGAGSVTTAERLNWLFDVVRPRADRPYTAHDVARAVSERLGAREGEAALAVAISELRSGQPLRLSRLELEAMAEFFGVSAAYFGVSEETLIETQVNLVWAELRRGGVESIRLCRTDDLDSDQWLTFGMIMLSCLRTDVAPQPDGRTE